MSALFATAMSKSLRVFVVENHRDSREMLQMYLEMLGHTVLTAESMTEALNALPQSNCDVLLSDIGLEDGDGWELLRRLRLSRPIYAIAMSGFGLGADRITSQEAGYRRHLLKPVDSDELDAALQEAASELDLSR